MQMGGARPMGGGPMGATPMCATAGGSSGASAAAGKNDFGSLDPFAMLNTPAAGASNRSGPKKVAAQRTNAGDWDNW